MWVRQDSPYKHVWTTTGLTLYITKRTSTKPVASHFNLPHHTIEQLQVMIIKRLHNDDLLLRRIREFRWMCRLQTVAPSGMNLHTDHLYIICLVHFCQASISPRCHLVISTNTTTDLCPTHLMKAYYRLKRCVYSCVKISFGKIVQLNSSGQ